MGMGKKPRNKPSISKISKCKYNYSTFMSLLKVMREILKILTIRKKYKIYKMSFKFLKILFYDKLFNDNRSKHIVLSILYIASRNYRIPILLIDFSKLLKINIFDLSSIYYKVIKALCNKGIYFSHGIYDLSQFLTNIIIRFRSCYNISKVSNLCLKIISLSNKAWLMEGRHPYGIIGASLYISLLYYSIN